MLYQSPTQANNPAPTEWLQNGAPRRSAYRIFVTCLSTSAQRVETLVTRSLQAKGAGVRVHASSPSAAHDGPRTRMVFSISGSGEVRGAIATLINLLGADTCVRAVRWESNPQSA
ncbi:MAG TPA: hypothetical protein VGN52_07940 [Burkholderiales bacterium]|jgi:hypothetical protein